MLRKLFLFLFEAFHLGWGESLGFSDYVSNTSEGRPQTWSLEGRTMFAWKFITSDWGFLPLAKEITFRLLCIYDKWSRFSKRWKSRSKCAHQGSKCGNQSKETVGLGRGGAPGHLAGFFIEILCQSWSPPLCQAANWIYVRAKARGQGIVTWAQGQGSAPTRWQ